MISWRRNKIIELKSQGLSQEEIARTLQVSPSTVTCDLNYLSQEAMENISEYTTKQYPIWFKACLVGIQNSMKLCWNIAQNSQDNKEKMMALEHYRQFYMDMLAMIGWRGQAALQDGVDKLNKSQPTKYKDGDIVMPGPGEQFSPHTYHSDRMDRNGNS
jgi:IS30 family transposase